MQLLRKEEIKQLVEGYDIDNNFEIDKPLDDEPQLQNLENKYSSYKNSSDQSELIREVYCIALHYGIAHLLHFCVQKGAKLTRSFKKSAYNISKDWKSNEGDNFFHSLASNKNISKAVKAHRSLYYRIERLLEYVNELSKRDANNLQAIYSRNIIEEVKQALEAKNIIQQTPIDMALETFKQTMLNYKGHKWEARSKDAFDTESSDYHCFRNFKNTFRFVLHISEFCTKNNIEILSLVSDENKALMESLCEHMVYIKTALFKPTERGDFHNWSVRFDVYIYIDEHIIRPSVGHRFGLPNSAAVFERESSYSLNDSDDASTPLLTM